MNLQLKTGEELFLVLIMGLLLIFSLVILFIVITLFIQVRHILVGVDPQAVPSEPFWKKWFNNAVPTTQEETILLDHNYDGIRELDNHLPPWWIGLFYGTIVFGVLYLANYHFWRWSPLQDDEYSQEMAAAKIEVEKFQAKQANSISETNVTLLTDEAGISKGKEIFTANCVACHGAALEGGVGPNLTDVYWLHGGGIQDVFKVVKYGVPEKGMIAWQATLKPNEIQAVSSYILSMQGTNPANAKEPQGEEYKPAVAVAEQL
ncbi:MAG: cbb3-type cytochrome c oxidase N-terminal domain-containing protein [Spirosomataceae bacterium]|jgi:cytochrome c oxidase cbb3-type subunit 3